MDKPIAVMALNSQDKKRIFDRIHQAMAGMKRADLASQMVRSGFPVTVKAISAWSSGISAPTSDSLIGLSRVLGVSIDWILTGHHPENPDLQTIRALFDKAAATAGYDITRKTDPTLQKIIDIALELPEAERIRLASLIDAFAHPKNEQKI